MMYILFINAIVLVLGLSFWDVLITGTELSSNLSKQGIYFSFIPRNPDTSVDSVGSVTQQSCERPPSLFCLCTLSPLLVVCLYIYMFIYLFLGPHPQHVEVPSLGSNWSYRCWPTPQPQQCRIRATSVTYTTAHGNTRSLTH